MGIEEKVIDFDYKPRINLSERFKLFFKPKYEKNKFLANRAVDEAFEFSERMLKNPEYKKRYKEMKSMTSSPEEDIESIIKTIKKNHPEDIEELSRKKIIELSNEKIKENLLDVYRCNVQNIPWYDADKFEPYLKRCETIPQRESLKHFRKTIDISNHGEKRGKYLNNTKNGKELIRVGGGDLQDLYTVSVHELGHAKTYGSTTITEKEKIFLRSIFNIENDTSNYIKSPSEIIARMDEIRAILNPENPYAPIKPEQIKELIPKVKKDSTMEKLLNNINIEKFVEVYNSFY